MMTTTPPIATHNPWEHPLPDAHAPPLSERLIRALEAHLAAGVHEVTDCGEVAHGSGHPVVQLLLGMIIEDEQRHSMLLQQMVRRLQQDTDFTPSAAATLPTPGDSELTGDETVVARLRALIRDEEEGARYLRHLARQEPTLYDGLFSVLLETVARDSQKHAYVLRYLLRNVEGR